MQALAFEGAVTGMCIRLALVLALVLAVGMIRGATGAASAAATPTPTGTISGMAIDDENGNGVIDPGEPALAAWEVAISGAMAATTQVAADGTYRFEDLSPGAYTVNLIAVVGGAGPPPPWIPTLPGPELRYEVSLAAGQNAENIDFAIQLLDEAAKLRAEIMMDAAPAPDGTLVQALIGETVCDKYTVGIGPSSGRQGPIFTPHTRPNTIWLVVPSANEKAGCGTEGATITFLIDGRPANETEPWYPGQHTGMWMVTAGPPFATYLGTVAAHGGEVHGSEVTAHIGDTPCSSDYGSLFGTYLLIVLPEELKPGCGTEGAAVRFMIGEAEAEQTAQWAPGRHDLNLTAAAATPSPTSVPTPAATPTVAATPAATVLSTPTPSTAPPTLPPSPTRSPTASATPFPTGPGLCGAGIGSSDGGGGWWPFALAAGLVAALCAGGLLVWARKRGRQAR